MVLKTCYIYLLMSEIEINKYQKGKIYKIWNSINDEIYVGSTCEALSRRMVHHRSAAKLGKSCKLYNLMNELGVEHFCIELIESFPCKSKEELNAREGKWIREIGTLNTLIAGRSNKQYKQENAQKIQEQNKEYQTKNPHVIQAYREKNKDTIQKYHKEYYQQNRESLNDAHKAYTEEHKEAIAKYHQEYHKEWLAKNKARITETIVCPCGTNYQICKKSRHSKSQRHQAYEETLKPPN